MGEGEWLARKHGASRPRQWCKVHLGIDAETLDVRAIEVTGSRVGDGPCSPSCWSRSRPKSSSAPSRRTGPTTPDPVTPPSPRERLQPSSRPAAMAGLGGRPHQEPRPATRSYGQAVASVAGPGKGGAAIISEVSSRPGCGASSSSVSVSRHEPPAARPPDRQTARPPDRQTAELQIRAALLNRFSALGAPETVRAA